MKIRFLGLVAHITLEPGQQTERQLAALVAAAGHKATLSCRTSSVVHAPNGFGTVSGSTTCFPLMGRVRMPDLGSGRLSVRDIADVPSLGIVTTGHSLSAELEKAQPNPAVFQSVLRLPPGGKLGAEDYFKYEVDFNGTRHGALARTVLFLVSTPLDVRIEIGGPVYNGGPATITLKNDAILTIANVCEETTGNHFQNYKRVFDPAAPIVYDPDDSAQRLCTFSTPQDPLPACATESTLQVDCSNSGYP
jgi:hypothetical protein